MNDKYVKWTLVVAGLGACLLPSRSARADSTCWGLVSQITSQLSYGGQFPVYISEHRQDPHWGVQYMEGRLIYSDDPGNYSGCGFESFSIRRAPGRGPFTGDDEFVCWVMDWDGVFHIHNYTWNFDFAPIDFSCIGNVMTTYQPGQGVFTLTFGDYVP
jgi:hypothetical protein